MVRSNIGISGFASYLPPHRVQLSQWCRWTGDQFDKILRCAHPHDVFRFYFGQLGKRKVRHLQHDIDRLPNAQATDCKALEGKIEHLLGMDAAP